MNLGDLLPESFRKEFAAEHLKVGAVIRSHVTFTRPPKIKRFIIAGLSDDLETAAVICINSEINFNVIGSQELLDLQYYLACDDREYVDHDSFADCSELHIMKIRAITGAIVNDTTSVLGEVSGDDLTKIKALIKGAKTISIRQKKEYHLFY